MTALAVFLVHLVHADHYTVLRCLCEPRSVVWGTSLAHCYYNSAMTIPDCQLDYIWNELQSRIGWLTCHPELEAGRHRFLIWILTWVTHAFDPDLEA